MARGSGSQARKIACRHWTNSSWPAGRVILTALTDHLEKSFFLIDVQFKAICSPVKTSYLPVENFNKTPDNRDNLRVGFKSL